MTDVFTQGTDWEQSSGPILSRNVLDTDMWPHGAPKDDLADGLHPMLAIGQIANRETNIVGVMLTYNSTNDMAVMNFAPGFISRQYVANVTGYNHGNGGEANAWAATVNVGDLVYIDDSAALAAGVTLSLAPANDANADNPPAGIVWRCQDEDVDSYIGGANSDPFPKSFTASNATHYLRLCIMLWPVVVE